ncbi:hypothetical protein T492DRAFT_32666 [Pavlovales sp. CCMP2436]|nr:hypothetical protein T492DRAFT_32666 [Pavlovales sp. CCMP2436]
MESQSLLVCIMYYSIYYCSNLRCIHILVIKLYLFHVVIINGITVIISMLFSFCYMYSLQCRARLRGGRSPLPPNSLSLSPPPYRPVFVLGFEVGASLSHG